MLSLLLSFCFFSPPPNWQPAEFPEPSPYIQSYFVGETGGLLFSTEQTDVSLRTYTDIVRGLHAENPGVTCRDLGRFETEAGPARLLELSAGPTQQLQLLLIADGIAYALTGTAPEETFPSLRPLFLASFRSLRHVPSLSASLPEGPNRTQFAQALENLGATLPFSDYQNMILTQYNSMGLHWQVVALQAGKKKIDSAKTP